MAHEKTTMFLVEFSDRAMCWCELGLDRKTGDRIWIDFARRGIPREMGKPVYHMEVDHWTDTSGADPICGEMLRKSAEKHLLRPESSEGWIAPNGTFFGCGFFRHDEMAHAFFGCHVSSLEMEGYVRVHASSYQHARDCDVELTKAQRKTLEGLGFYDAGHGFSNRLFERDRTPLRRSLVYVPSGRVAAPPFGDADARQRAKREKRIAERERRKQERDASAEASAPKT